MKNVKAVANEKVTGIIKLITRIQFKLNVLLNSLYQITNFIKIKNLEGPRHNFTISFYNNTIRIKNL